jgi:hypothetical protein
MHGRLALLAGIVLALCAASATASPETVRCPASAGASAGAVQWEFTALGVPNAPSGRVNWSWTRGRGSWNAGKASGTVCAEDRGRGIATRDLVLTASGNSLLTPHTTQHGMLGVSLVIGVRVHASDDAHCVTGTRGTITLFASYYSVHVDTIALHFAAACSDHNHGFSGSVVHVLIARNGAQVNST